MTYIIIEKKANKFRTSDATTAIFGYVSLDQ